MATQANRTDIDALLSRFRDTRSLSVRLAEPLSDADATVQSMPDASPAKWHLAHTTWFFETFVLRDFVPGYVPFDPAYHFLFNSYYDAEGDRHARPRRGMLTRPALDDIRAYRTHVDLAVEAVLQDLPDHARDLVELGCHHEAQHQELLLTDVLHLFAQNPLNPALWTVSTSRPSGVHDAIGWIAGPTGRVDIGHAGDDFAFDCEGPRHSAWLSPHAIADRLVTNAEWRVFIADGGYKRPDLWLSDGWGWVQSEGIDAPLYWRGDEAFGLEGLRPLDLAAPVAHVSFYEADAYARWAGARLPTEFEWEGGAADPAMKDAFGKVWQWTASAFLPYPGFRPPEGAVGEYNGKFMSGQMVLRGSSIATPDGTSRVTTRNFFPPTARWQFSGLRLAKDL
ncbi:MAG: ergothioneine biosynthesis protein EgtB [Pseudomonadota bacterium]